MKKLLFLFFFALINTTASAQSVAYIQPGSKAGTVSGVLNLATGNTIQVGAAKDRSIFCGSRSPTLSTQVFFSENISCGFSSCSPFTGREVGHIDNGVNHLGTPSNAISFTAPAFESYVITLNLISPSPSNVIIECFDTTLFGNFNTVTAANPFNFLEITNDTRESADATVILYANSGTELSRFNIRLSAHQQRDIAIHDIAGAANTFGSISISHNSVPNAIRANLTKYTSSFVITASTPLMARPNNL